MPVPDLRGSLFDARDGRIVLGENLVLVWKRLDPRPDSPATVQVMACEGDGTRLAVLAEIPLLDAYIYSHILADLMSTCSATALRMYPQEARSSVVETP